MVIWCDLPLNPNLIRVNKYLSILEALDRNCKPCKILLAKPFHLTHAKNVHDSVKIFMILKIRNFVDNLILHKYQNYLKEISSCMDYGSDAEFKSYADCIENEYDKIFRPILGCKVRALGLKL